MKKTVMAGALVVAAGAAALGLISGPVGARLSAGTAPDTTGPVIARMGDATLDAGTLQAALGAAPPAGPDGLAALGALARQEALRAWLADQARAAGLDEQLAVQTRRAVQQVLVDAWLAQQARPAADYPPEPLARAFYDANRDRYRVPARYRVAQIWVARPAQADQVPAAREHAQSLARQAAARDADFAALAASQSAHAGSAANGGALGWVGLAQLRPEVREAVDALEPGTVSKAIELPDGWHILRVDERTDAATLSYEQALPDIRAVLRAQETVARREAYLARLLTDHPVAVDEIALRDWQSRHAAAPAVTDPPAPETPAAP